MQVMIDSSAVKVFQQKLAFVERIDFAIALAVDPVIPMVKQRAPMIKIADGLDKVIDLAVGPVERLPALAHQPHVDGGKALDLAFLWSAASEIYPTVWHARF